MSATGQPVVLGLGSNLDDRETHLRRALEALQAIALGQVQKSRIFETPPVGPGPQGPYLNQCVRFQTRLGPRELLRFCKETERRLGRQDRERWAAREIDLDILLYGRERIREEGLEIPHPRLRERQFVLAPLTDLDPELVVPGGAETVAELLDRCIRTQGPAAISEYRVRGDRPALPEHIRYVCVEGVIGVGKSTLVRLLGERLGCAALMEEFENNPFLSDFYQDRSRFAFQTQLFFLLSRYRQIQDTFQQQDLFRERMVSDYMFAKDRIFASINLDENELALYRRLSDILDRDLVRPDYVVYLQADTPTLQKRIRMRDRPYERGMPDAYLDALNRAYNDFFHHYDDSPLLIVNTNHIDFVKSPDDLELLVQQILKVPEGANYFSPVRGR